ncbi:hypothetical protein L1987_60660 [Smallanthus sonchifolius]|uniref:Uncharacterized protein n=1 Tax=Smallanthus sonchifolius TaxID=185202 RepID=A0ACB9D9K9_9ASTR|nr:hypothetical protein L1987_60660 [Smallanthus sonchifolius]
MGEPVKGTVTSLSSVFTPEDAQKASVRVQEKISERQKEVQQLQAFLNDNTSPVNLVKKLPDQLHHNIMAKRHQKYGGSLGDMLYFHSFRNPCLVIDVLQGEHIPSAFFSSQVTQAKSAASDVSSAFFSSSSLCEKSIRCHYFRFESTKGCSSHPIQNVWVNPTAALSFVANSSARKTLDDSNSGFFDFRPHTHTTSVQQFSSTGFQDRDLILPCL